MTQATAIPQERAQQLAGGASPVAVVGVVLIALVAVAGDVGPIITAVRNREVTPDLPDAAALIRAVGVFWLMGLPSFLLAGAMLDLSKVLVGHGKGRCFTRRASGQRRKAGVRAIGALAFKIVASRTIVSWIMTKAVASSGARSRSISDSSPSPQPSWVLVRCLKLLRNQS